MKYIHALLIFSWVIMSTSCDKKKDDPEPQVTLEATVVKNLDADTKRTGKYTLFSFKDNAVVPNSDSATTKWDIGFNRTTIVVNGGISGSGSAMGQIVVGVFDEILEAPESGYVVDDSKSKAVSSWYNYSGSPDHIITPIPGRVLIIKTSDGKYAKMEIISYYKDAPATPASQDPTSGWYTFRYIYQPDGSRNFK